jgi:hypothetical protein
MVDDFTCKPDHQLDTGWGRFLAANDSDDRLAGPAERTLDLATWKMWVRTTPSRTGSQPRHYHGSSPTRASRRTSTSHQVGNCFRHTNKLATMPTRITASEYRAIHCPCTGRQPSPVEGKPAGWMTRNRPGKSADNCCGPGHTPSGANINQSTSWIRARTPRCERPFMACHPPVRGLEKVRSSRRDLTKQCVFEKFVDFAKHHLFASEKAS